MVKRLIKKHYTQMKLTKQEFFKFLEYYGIIGMAIGIVMGTAVKDYVNEFVSSIINPLIAYALPDIETLEGWKVANFGIGAFISATINFLIVAFIVFAIARWILKKEKIERV